MELDLVKANCTSFKIALECKFTPQLIKKIEDSSALPPNDIKTHGVAFGSVYLVDEKKYTAMGFVLKGSIRGTHLVIFEYQIGSILKKDIALKPISQLLECLKELEGSYEFECNSKYLYSHKQFSSAFPLPIKANSTQFNEIRGIRLYKKMKGGPSFEIIIENVKNNDTYHNLSCEYKGECSSDLISIIFRYVSDLSKGYVFSS